MNYLEEIAYLLDDCVAKSKESAWIAPEAIDMSDPQKVFVVHGRNKPARDAMFAFLRALSLHPIEWSQATSMTGKGTPSTGEIVDAGLNAAQAVVVVITGDDEVSLREQFKNSRENKVESRTRLQARPNVIFEAGLAFGKKPHKVIIVEIGENHPFSDIHGLNTVRMPGGEDERMDLKERLKTCGCDLVDTGSDWLRDGDFEAAVHISESQTGIE